MAAYMKFYCKGCGGELLARVGRCPMCGSVGQIRSIKRTKEYRQAMKLQRRDGVR